MPLWLPVATPTKGSELQLLICQAWHELLHPQTPDSFRARVLDLSLTLDDMLHVTEIAAADRRWAAYLPAMADELREQLLSEQRLVPSGSANWRAVEAVIDDAKHQRVGTLKPKILIAKGMFGRAEERLCDDIKQLVATTPLRKEALLKRLSTIASHICYRGMGEESLKLIEPGLLTLSVEEVMERLFSPLQAPERTFTCTLAVAGGGNDVAYILMKTAFSPVRRRRLNSRGASKQWANGHPDCILATAVVSARSSYSAAESAMQDLAQALNVHNLYTNGAKFRVHSEVLVEDASGALASVQVAPSSHFGLLPRSSALSLTIDRLKHVNNRLSGRLANALECHATALAAEDPRTAIISLWTALEAIAGSGEATSIGQRVANAISPIVASRRIDKIITYLALGIHDVAVKRRTFIDRSVMTRSSYTNINNDDVLEAVSGPDGNSKITYLLAFSEPSPLLRQRLYGAWKAFHDPAQVRSDLLASRERVEWQIFRIYRARNLLVHKGEHSHLVWRLLQNAQYYVSASLSRVLHDLSDQASWGIDESLTYQAMHLDYLCDRLKEGGGIAHRDVLGTRSRDPSLEVWGPRTAPTA
jgi:hypothetical protein